MFLVAFETSTQRRLIGLQYRNYQMKFRQIQRQTNFLVFVQGVALFASQMFVVAMAFFASAAHGANPFVTSIYTADPSAHVWNDGRLYVYPSHDMDPPRGCDLMDRYHIFSTDDMENWRDEGEILRANQVAWGRPEGGFMWAPDCAYKDGTYFFYYPHPSGSEWNKTWKIGVATSSKPASDFTTVGYIGGLDGNAMIDPCVFVDTDGQVYIYYGGGGVCKGGKLKQNMVEVDGKMMDMGGLVDFHEATWVFKRGEKYYLTYADNRQGANQMRYATSSNPLGPWKHCGVYIESTGCDTMHGSVVEYKGQWYQFYHNQSLSGKNNLRSICLDKLYFNDDGSIRTMMQTKGLGAATTLDPFLLQNTVKYAVANAVFASGARLEEDDAAADGGSAHELHLNGACLQFNQVEGRSRSGKVTICVHFASADNAKLKLVVNDVDYSFLNASATGGWDRYSGRTFLTVPFGPGKTNTIRLVGGHGGVNVDCITVSPLP